MAATIQIQVEKGKGVRGTKARVNSVSESIEANALGAAISLPLRFLHDTVLEHSGWTGERPERDLAPIIFIPKSVDGELGYSDFEPVPLGVAPAPRSVYTNPPTWIIDAVRRANGDHFMWQSVGDELVVEKKAIEETESPLGVKYASSQMKTLRGGEITELEVALTVLVNVYGTAGKPSNRWLNETCCGWLDDEQRGAVFVSDLYEIDEMQLLSVQTFVAESGLRFSIGGTSAHRPSRTMRLKIWKA